MADPSGLTIEQVDRALAAAREQDLPEPDVAMLWCARAGLTGVSLTADHLQIVMGVTAERADELLAVLEERGLVDRVNTPRLEQALADGLIETAGWDEYGDQIYRFKGDG